MSNSDQKDPPTTDPPVDGSICDVELQEYADEMWAESEVAKTTPPHLQLPTKCIWELGWMAGYRASLKKML